MVQPTILNDCPANGVFDFFSEDTKEGLHDFAVEPLVDRRRVEALSRGLLEDWAEM
jgi:hypothetical protein